MKQMKSKDGTIINVVQHIILRNFWEYYVTDDVFQDDIVKCLVLGDSDEMGDVPLNEIKPYVISSTKDMSQVSPAPGWEWIDSK